MSRNTSSQFRSLLRSATFLAFLLITVCNIPTTASAQSPITARVDRDTVALDEQVVLTVTITGDFLRIPRPDLSAMQDFVTISSSTSTQVSIVNGRMTSQGVFIYRLQPLGAGTLQIPPISVNIDGQVYLSEPIEIQVSSAGSPLAPQAPDQAEPSPSVPTQEYFVEAEVDNANPYLGEQIIFTFRIYQSSFFPPGQPDYTPPRFTDFWTEEINSQPHFEVETNGRNYQVTEILTALFPANLGTLTIEPASLVIPGEFLNPDIRLESEPVTVNVRPLPELDRPEAFSGAVGQFDILASLSEAEIVVNHPVTLIMQVLGTGNIRTLTEPVLPELAEWRVFESQPTTTVETSDGVVQGSRIFERLVVPGQVGEQLFPPVSFSYYDPQAELYRTISTDPIPISVLPDEQQPSLPTVLNSRMETQRNSANLSDIRHIKPVPSVLSPASRAEILNSVLYWTAWIVPLPFIVAAFVWQRRRDRFRADLAYAREVRAKREALKILSEAQLTKTDGPAAASRSLLGYLSDKLNKPTSGLTREGLIKLLTQAKVPGLLIEQIAGVLQQVDIGRFAPISAGDSRALIDDTRSLIDDLEKHFSRRRPQNS